MLDELSQQRLIEVSHAGSTPYNGVRDGPHVFMGDPDHHRDVDVRMLHERAFDLGGVNVGTAADDEVRPPIGEKQIALVIQPTIVSYCLVATLRATRSGANIVIGVARPRSEEHTSELPSLMRIS